MVSGICDGITCCSTGLLYKRVEFESEVVLLRDFNIQIKSGNVKKRSVFSWKCSMQWYRSLHCTKSLPENFFKSNGRPVPVIFIQCTSIFFLVLRFKLSLNCCKDSTWALNPGTLSLDVAGLIIHSRPPAS